MRDLANEDRTQKTPVLIIASDADVATLEHSVAMFRLNGGFVVRLRTILAFSAIFIVWGSTYLAIKYAVAEIPPFLTAGIRHLTAGSVMLLWARAKGQRATLEEWWHSAVVGLLFFLIGHGLVHRAERFVPSGEAALLIATEPVWIALLLAVTARSRLRLGAATGLLLGLLGVWVVVGSDPAGSASALGTFTVVISAIAWGAGVVYSQRAPLPADATMRTATTLLTGAAMLLGLSGLAGEFAEARTPSALAIGSLAYLIVFGSILAFTAYFWLLERYSATLVATHTFVNPAVAVTLGWAIGDEVMSASLVLGLVVIAASIALVRQAASTAQSDHHSDPTAACSSHHRQPIRPQQVDPPAFALAHPDCGDHESAEEGRGRSLRHVPPQRGQGVALLPAIRLTHRRRTRPNQRLGAV